MNVGDEFSPAAIRRMLEWAYTNRIKDVDEFDAMEVLELLRLWRSVGSAVCGLQELGLRSVLNYRLQ